MRFKKIIALVLSAAVVTGVCGCSGGTKKSGGEKIRISIADWPPESDTAKYKEYMDKKAAFEEKYSNIEIIPDEWSYGVDTFLPKAASGKLPTMYNTPVTEVDKIINSGYALDITKFLDKYGYTDAIKDEIWDLCERDGKKYFLPIYAYTFALYANIKLMKEIGAVEDDGTVHFPDTYEELGEMAQKIKETTGQPGFSIPTMNNMGGWYFMNIAYSYGVNFIEKDENGKWKATFNTPEAEQALQFIKDLKWKYNALPDSNLVDVTNVMKQYASDQVGMYFQTPHDNALTTTYGMDKNDIAIGKMPSGPAGRYALMGGGLYAFALGATDEQIDACFKWIDFLGQGPTFIDEASKQNLEDSYKTKAEQGYLLGYASYNKWNDDSEKAAFENSLKEKYINVEPNHIIQFADFSDTVIKPEPEVSCQQLYTIIDNMLQEVMIDENADVAAILEEGNNTFQTEYLDNVEW